MNQTDIENLQKNMAFIYEFDLQGIIKDAAAIEQKLNDGSEVDALDFYLNRPPPGSPPGTDPPLPGLAAEIITPEIPDLERFEFSDIAEDHTLRDRLIEQNLESAFRYLQQCTSLKKEYREIAKLHLDTKLKTQEFFKLDNIHQEEILAGVYKNPYLDAEDDKTAAVTALAAAQQQKQVADDLYKNDPSPDPNNDSYLGSFANKRNWYLSNQGNNASYINWNVPNYRLTIAQLTEMIGRYQENLEDASWKVSQNAAIIYMAEWTGKVAVATRKAEYLRKDIIFRGARAAVSRQLAYKSPACL